MNTNENTTCLEQQPMTALEHEQAGRHWEAVIGWFGLVTIRLFVKTFLQKSSRAYLQSIVGQRSCAVVAHSPTVPTSPCQAANEWLPQMSVSVANEWCTAEKDSWPTIIWRQERERGRSRRRGGLRHVVDDLISFCWYYFKTKSEYKCFHLTFKATGSESLKYKWSLIFNLPTTSGRGFNTYKLIYNIYSYFFVFPCTAVFWGLCVCVWGESPYTWVSPFRILFQTEAWLLQRVS